MHLFGTGTFRPISPVVFVQVARGVADCELLERAIRSGPLDRALEFPYHPHVTVAHDVDDDALDEAYDGLAGFVARFTVESFQLFERLPTTAAGGSCGSTRSRGYDVAVTSKIGAVAGQAGSRWERIKRRNPWLVHVLRAYQRLNDHNGSYYAAGITYFSFLALFPLLLLAVSILGFVLNSHPDLLHEAARQGVGAGAGVVRPHALLVDQLRGRRARGPRDRRRAGRRADRRRLDRQPALRRPGDVGRTEAQTELRHRQAGRSGRARSVSGSPSSSRSG